MKITAVLFGVFLFSPLTAVSSRALDVPSAQGLLDLNCMEALAAVGQADLAGVFSFIPGKDTPGAFADLLVHQKKALGKFLDKDEKDFKATGAVSQWDHQTLQFVLSIYASPLASTVDKPKKKELDRIDALSQVATLSLEEMELKRKQ